MTWSMGARGLLAGGAVSLAALVSAGCPAQPQASPAPAPCAPVRATLAPGARSDGLAGDYRLTLVATRGARSGRSVTGRMRLTAYARPAQDAGGTRWPMYGTAAVA